MDFWDLIFKRYSSPFLFLDNLILQGRFSDGIDTIYKQVDEEKMWQLYLSSVTFRAMNNDFKSYYDWKNETLSQNEEKPTFEVAEDKEDIEEVKNKARNILKNFKPE